MSKFYQKYWGKRFSLRGDQNTKSNFGNTVGGARISTSSRGSLLGIGGDIILIDDPHNTTSAESEAERLQALNWWREISNTRLNDPKQSAIVVIMQRLHEEDVSGVILGSDSGAEWVHLCIPMEYEWRRHCVTDLGWADPRGADDSDGDGSLVVIDDSGSRVPRDTAAGVELEKREGTLMWPERFGPHEIGRMKAELGPYMASGRLQQQPAPARGGIFPRDLWLLYEPEAFGQPAGKWPIFDYIVASLDGAYTEKEQNDPSALTIWGVWSPGARKLQLGTQLVDAGAQSRIMLIHAWRKHVPFSGPRAERGQGETWQMFKWRTSKDWGLIEWLFDSFMQFSVNGRTTIDKLLIEATAPGISAAQELRNRFKIHHEAIQLITPKGDKVARALSVQPMFSQWGIYAPDKDWAEDVIKEMSMFPLGQFDDLTDSATQALRYLRDVGMGQTDDEQNFSDMDRMTHRGRTKPLYPGMGA